MTDRSAAISVSDLGRDAEGVVRGLRGSGQPLVIEQEGEAAAVLLSVEAFERARRERAILLQLARGEAEIEAGQGFSLDDVLAEADALLRDDPA